MKRPTTNLPGDYAIFIVYTIRKMYIDISFYKYYERYVYVELGSLLCSMDAAVPWWALQKEKKTIHKKICASKNPQQQQQTNRLAPRDLFI